MNRSKTVIFGVLGATGLLALAGCGGGSSTTSPASTASGSAYPQSTATTASDQVPAAAARGGVATVSVAHNGALGSILVAGPQRRTVYLFAADKGPHSTCSSACAEVWPPLTTSGSPKATGGAHSADLGTITRSDGTKQVTYKGHPLYYYVGDPKSGDTSGQGINSFGAAWYVLSPSGSEVK
jgi:predicted lipoprotein with Yx(FWY)xxD motif